MTNQENKDGGDTKSAESEKTAQVDSEHHDAQDKEETVQHDVQDKAEPLQMATEVANRLNQKVEELKEVEAQIEKKMGDFKKFVAETKVEGRALAGQPPKKEESAAEYKDRVLKGDLDD